MQSISLSSQAKVSPQSSVDRLGSVIRDRTNKRQLERDPAISNYHVHVSYSRRNMDVAPPDILLSPEYNVSFLQVLINHHPLWTGRLLSKRNPSH